MYHFVWIPKCRRMVFVEPYRPDLNQSLEMMGYDYDIKIVVLEVPDDYIHMVVRTEPKIVLSYVMRVFRVYLHVSFLEYIQKLSDSTFGVLNFGLKTTS